MQKQLFQKSVEPIVWNYIIKNCPNQEEDSDNNATLAHQQICPLLTSPLGATPVALISPNTIINKNRKVNEINHLNILDEVDELNQLDVSREDNELKK